jgi:hypothetical protein
VTVTGFDWWTGPFEQKRAWRLAVAHRIPRSLVDVDGAAWDAWLLLRRSGISEARTSMPR